MSEHDQEHDDEQIDLATEERLRRAVRFRDAEVAPSADALMRIRQRATTMRTPRWQRPGVLLGAVAAVAVVVAGLAIVFRSDDDAPDLSTDVVDSDTASSEDPDRDTDVPDDAAPSSSVPTTSTTAPPDTAAQPEPSPQELADQGLIVWPLDSRSFEDATSVAWSYATQALGIDDPVLETDCCEDRAAVVTIAQRGEDGAPFGQATRLDVVSLDQFNWVVVRASSDEVTLESVTFAGDGIATVIGSGRSFEGAARIVARSICDPGGVITPLTVGGGPEFADFEQTAAFVPCEGSPLVVELATEGALATDVPFVSALAVPEGAAEVDVTWSVMRVASDDVLNVRSGQGVGNDIVATLAPDAAGITLLGESAEASDGATWQRITTPDGVEGWVNAEYLTAQAPLDDDEARALALEALQILASGGDPAAAFSSRGVHVGGIGVYADAPTPFVRVDRGVLNSDELIDWNPFPDEEDCRDDCRRTVREFLDVTSVIDRVDPRVGVDVTADIAVEDQYLQGPIPQLEMFGSLHSVTVEVPATSDGDLDWRRYHLWFDWADGQARVIAVYRWGWTP